MLASYFKAFDGTPLYGVYHAPQMPAAKNKCPVLICPPLFEERKSAYAPLRKLAEKLAQAGHPVFRFDYRGSGESGGYGGARRGFHLIEDASAAQATLALISGIQDVIFLGLRMGGTVALYAAKKAHEKTPSALDQKLRVFVLALAPMVHGETQVRLWKLRSKIRAELTISGDTILISPSLEGDISMVSPDIVDFDGYEVCPEFFEDVAALDLCNDLKEVKCPTRILQLSHRTELAPETQQLLTTMGPQAQGGALRIEAFWDKLDDVDTLPLEQAVLEWAGRIS